MLYFAGPLFSMAERQFNARLASLLEEQLHGWSILLPQEACSSAIKAGAPWKAVYDICCAGIEQCSAVVAVLEGSDADSGTCVELGYARGLGRTIIGVRTDSRLSEDRGLNVMVANVCDAIVSCDAWAEVEELAARVAEAVRERAT